MCPLHQLTFGKLSHNTSPQSITPKPVTSGAISPPIHDESSASAAHRILSNLGFIVKVEEIRPNGMHPNRSSEHPQGFFLPPNRRNGYDSGSSHLFQFRHGVLTLTSARYLTLKIYSAATVFSQAPSTDHLLMVPFDARNEDVVKSSYDWRSLSFAHKMGNSSSRFASLGFIGEEDKLPAPVPLAWHQLVPKPYRYQDVDEEGKQPKPDTKIAGLTGPLPLLIALVAFSAVPSKLSTVLENHVINGIWHPHIYDTGRKFLCLLCHKIQI